MNCPKCGATNGNTNKFCRECGTALPPEHSTGKPDDAALREELIEVWQLYSAGKLDAALAKVNAIAERVPDSASVHSVMGLVYERKSEEEQAAGRAEAGRDFIKLAITQYEKILSLNPKSAADRQKLASLQAKLTGESFAPPKPGINLSDIRKALKSVPPPALAGFGTFIVLLMLLIILIPGGKRARRGHQMPRLQAA